MQNIEIIEVPNVVGEMIEHVIIRHDDGSYTSMTKAHYDELEANKENGTLNNGGLN